MNESEKILLRQWAIYHALDFEKAVIASTGQGDAGRVVENANYLFEYAATGVVKDNPALPLTESDS